MMKKYIITGSTSGIGRALVEELSKSNIVFAGYRNSAKVDELFKNSENIIPFYIDMKNCASISDAADFIKSKTDKIDTLINVAGSVLAGAVENLEIQDLKEQFQINTFSHLEFSNQLLSILDGGKIINISSMSSFGIFPFIAPYCASKRALDILFNSLMVETKKNIKVISIKPGVIATPLWERSVNENFERLKDDSAYGKEMKFLKENALKNGVKGLNVKKVVEVIKKVDELKNPKSSYLVGKDAVMASIFSHLPVDMLNFLTKQLMKKRVNTIIGE